MTQQTTNTSQANWRQVLGLIGARKEVPAEGVRFAMDQIMTGQAVDAQVAAFAFGIFAKGITAAELDAAATGMLSHAADAGVPDATGAVDIVGTGGDGAHTVNISTMSSVVVAASGTPVLKHGNRAASSKSGGADMLEALGIDSADGHVRSQLAVPTLFNLLGPLTNPAQPSCSLIGCAFEDQMETMAGAFARRGQRVLVVRGSDGLDEITVTGTTRAFVVEGGEVVEDVIDPRDYGMEFAPADSLRGGEPSYNADVARKVWNGDLRGPIRDAVLLNSAAALVAARGLEGGDLKSAMTRALDVVRDTLDSGRCAEIVAAATGR